ncbi:hypothetical protein JCM10449v2_005163 [Rhodotorula kratochvilovae]
MRTLLAFVLLAWSNPLILAQRCDAGLTLVPAGAGASRCCIAPGSIPGATCEPVPGPSPKTVCYWTRVDDSVHFTFTVPDAIQEASSIVLKGTYGERLNGQPFDVNRQRGSTIRVNPINLASGRVLEVYPGSFYGRPGGGLPPAGQRHDRGTQWARGGAASMVTIRGASAGGRSGSALGGVFWTGYNMDDSASNRMVTIEFSCGAPVPTTTISLPTPATTEYVTEVNTLSETSTLPSPTQFATVTVESATPPEYVDSTVTPDASYSTLTGTATTYPPESTEYSTFTPETSFFTESPSVETTPATSTVYETFTPATSYFTETVPATVTPDTVLETQTTTPPTRIIPSTITEQRTTSKGTSTVVVSSATGNANCVQFRMVYPAACCPTAYIKNMKKWTGPATLRRRNIHFARDLTTVYTPSGTTTTTVTTATTATSFVTPDPVLVTETKTTPGPVTTLTNLFTAEAETVVIDETTTIQGAASTRTVTVTADAPSFTVTETQYYEAATPLYTDISTADAPSEFATETSYSTLPAPISTVKVEGPTPVSTQTQTETKYQTVPATTTTSTAYTRATTCALKTVLTAKCPIPLLRGVDQVVQLALIKTNKFLSGNKPVQIDCGTAGVWSFT